MIRPASSSSMRFPRKTRPRRCPPFCSSRTFCAVRADRKRPLRAAGRCAGSLTGSTWTGQSWRRCALFCAGGMTWGVFTWCVRSWWTPAGGRCPAGRPSMSWRAEGVIAGGNCPRVTGAGKRLSNCKRDYPCHPGESVSSSPLTVSTPEVGSCAGCGRSKAHWSSMPPAGRARLGPIERGGEL